MSGRQQELQFIERHRDADLICDTKTGRVIMAVYPAWHPWGRLQRFLASVSREGGGE